MLPNPLNHYSRLALPIIDFEANIYQPSRVGVPTALRIGRCFRLHGDPGISTAIPEAMARLNGP